MKRRYLFAMTHQKLWIVLAGASLLGGSVDAEVSEGEKLFALKVKPLFAEKCNACHGDEPEKIKGDFDMRTRESLLKGGDYFGDEVLMPGEGEKSFLYLTTTRTEEDYEMPPKEADQLTEEQQWWIRDWINAGAPWPDDERVAFLQEKYAEGEKVSTSKALTEDWQERRYEGGKLWSYRPLQVSDLPEGRHPIDWFIDRKLKDAGLDPAPPAAALELVRRLSFGLTGLPPEPEEVKQFQAEYARDPAAAVLGYGRERMASPHYGEQFGRHWLDVARYADSAGFANDYARPNAWRYRDYVVRSFNEDKPYSEFVREQIAGDEIDPKNPELLVATGFLRMGPWEQTGMSVFKETRQMWLDDVTDSVGQTFLAHAMQCAKCHDHKFDPVPTRDYYRMMAVFSTTQFADRDAPFLGGESKEGFAERLSWTESKVKYTEAMGAETKKNVIRHKIEKDAVEPIAHAVYTGKTVHKKNVQGRQRMAPKPWANGYFDEDAILTGGDVYSPGDSVVPGALSAAESLAGMEVKPFPKGQGKRRLALADWIADPKNPLTARVMVNRVWSWHFGKGIAGNPNNFGGTGKPPTHPELLDYLANWFMENDWSVKKLNELIVSSAAFQRSSAHPDPERESEVDPKKETYASFLPRRLTAEELRDAMLVASGEWNPAVGGIPARPDINFEVAVQPRQIMGGTATVYEPDPEPEQRNRRSLYAERVRGLRDPFLETFNQPGPDDSCEIRETSTVAPQALTLMNTEEVQDRALALAARLLREDASDAQILDRAFQRTLGRPATDREREACLAHWKQASEEESQNVPEPKEFVTEVERTVRVEKTGEFTTFTEKLPAYEKYIPDLQRSDVDARTRGLSHICVVLFNLNEFSYLD